MQTTKRLQHSLASFLVFFLLSSPLLSLLFFPSSTVEFPIPSGGSSGNLRMEVSRGCGHKLASFTRETTGNDVSAKVTT